MHDTDFRVSGTVRWFRRGYGLGGRPASPRTGPRVGTTQNIDGQCVLCRDTGEQAAPVVLNSTEIARQRVSCATQQKPAGQTCRADTHSTKNAFRPLNGGQPLSLFPPREHRRDSSWVIPRICARGPLTAACRKEAKTERTRKNQIMGSRPSRAFRPLLHRCPHKDEALRFPCLARSRRDPGNNPFAPLAKKPQKLYTEVRSYAGRKTADRKRATELRTLQRPPNWGRALRTL